MAQYAHKGQILPLVNQMIPIDKQTTFHASYDYHLNGYNQGDLTRPIGRFPIVADFNNTTSTNKISAYVSALPTGASTRTMECWVMPMATISAGSPGIVGYPLSGKQTGVGAQVFEINISSAGNNHFGVHVWGNQFYGTTTIAYGTWYHVAATYDGTSVRLYVNGVLENTTAVVLNTVINTDGNPNFNIRRAVNPSDGTPACYISDVRVWNTCNSVAQIQSYMNQELTGYESGLIANFKLKEKEGIAVFDSSTYGNSGTRQGTVPNYYTSDIVATVQNGTAKFGGAVLLEPDATNLYTSQGAFNPSGGVTASYGSGTGIWSVTVASGSTSSWRGIYYKQSDAVMNPGDTGTVSFEVYADEVIPIYMDVNNSGVTTSTGVNDNDVVASRVFRTGNTVAGKWTKFSATYTFASSNTQNFYDQCTLMMSNGFVPAHDTTFKIRNIQCEKRDYPTSFVNGSRTFGKLYYPMSLINISAWTVGCWFNTPWMHRDNGLLTSGIQGNWYHPIFEIVPPIKSANTSGYTGFALLAGPQPSTWNRIIRMKYADTAGTSTEVTGVTAVQDNTWYHAIVTYDGTNLKLYVNGSLEKTQAASTIQYDSNCVVMIGGGYYGKPWSYIDEVRIESRAISSDEAAAWASSGIHHNYLDYSMYVD